MEFVGVVVLLDNVGETAADDFGKRPDRMAARL